MLGGKDENSSKDIRPVLNWLLQIRYEYKTSVIVIHHWNKSGKSDRGGQRMLGSVLFHGWVESAMYTRVVNEVNHQIEVEREFRSFPKPGNMNITFNFGQPGDDYYETRIGTSVETVAGDSLLSVLKEAGKCTIEELSHTTSIPMKQLRKRLDQLIKEDVVFLDNDIYIYKGE